MKSAFYSLLILVATLLVPKLFTLSAEIFTEGVRVSPETVKLKTGEYVWEPERAPDGPLLIVASITDQGSYMYIATVSVSRVPASAQVGRATQPQLAFSRSWKRKSIILRASTKARRCLTWSG